MKNNDTYLAAMLIVDNAMINPRITPHHHPAMWKNRSPVLSVKYV